MREKHVIKTRLKTSKATEARNAANLKAIHAMNTSCKRHALCMNTK